jgi:hypothetical protein
VVTGLLTPCFDKRRIFSALVGDDLGEPDAASEVFFALPGDAGGAFFAFTGGAGDAGVPNVGAAFSFPSGAASGFSTFFLMPSTGSSGFCFSLVRLGGGGGDFFLPGNFIELGAGGGNFFSFPAGAGGGIFLFFSTTAAVTAVIGFD